MARVREAELRPLQAPSSVERLLPLAMQQGGRLCRHRLGARRLQVTAMTAMPIRRSNAVPKRPKMMKLVGRRSARSCPADEARPIEPPSAQNRWRHANKPHQRRVPHRVVPMRIRHGHVASRDPSVTADAPPSSQVPPDQAALAAGPQPGTQSPFVPSASSRRMSRCPLCRAFSSMRCSRTHRRVGWSPELRALAERSSRSCRVIIASVRRAWSM